MPHVLAIDLGTTGLKAAVVRDDGVVLGIASRVITTHFVDDGGVEKMPTNGGGSLLRQRARFSG